jgi:adenylate kinase
MVGVSTSDVKSERRERIMKKPLNFILIGPPGCGKGTQAKLLADKFSLKYVGSGDILRGHIKINDFTGKKIANIINGGGLVPSFVIIKVFGEEIEKNKKQKVKGFVFDGWTRIIYEAILIDEALNWYELKNTKIILIKISAKESFDRLTKRRQCKNCKKLIPWIGKYKELKKCDACEGRLITRIDDNIKSIKKRLEEYKNQTSKSINYYKQQKRLIEINGEQPIEKVFKDILAKIK